MATPVTGLWTHKAPTLMSHLAAEYDLVLIFSISYVMDVHVPTVSLCLSCRCGTRLWLRRQRTGPTPACGSTGRLTSSGSWVKTSPSGQDGEWPLTPLTSAAPLRDDSLSEQSWSLPCSPLLLSPKSFCTVTWWLLEECSCDTSNKQKLCFQPWPMRTKAHPICGSWLSIWKHITSACSCTFRL